MSKECDQPKDWSRVKCSNCYQYGHGNKRCPEPAGGADAYGSGGGNHGGTAPAGWDTGSGDTTATAGGWDGGGVEAGAQQSSGDWADY